VLSDAGALNCWHELRMKRKDVERWPALRITRATSPRRSRAAPSLPKAW
jgi:hypothetical protein